MLLTSSALQTVRAEPSFDVRYAQIERVSDVFYLNAELQYQLGENLLEALHNGVKLGFEVQIEILRERRWRWDRSEAEISQRYRLEFHALSQLYVLTHMNTGVQRAFYRLGSALQAMGDIKALPLLDAALIDDQEAHYLRMRSLLRVDELPLPLRMRGYIAREWRPGSDWYQWPLP
ncbi:hypothetical protein CKX93_04800 [Ectothiorhodosinus mongolicus]|nr:hypothetical protein CKX93_04800 [Ectothiorhodosinus mongolicus]